MSGPNFDTISVTMTNAVISLRDAVEAMAKVAREINNIQNAIPNDVGLQLETLGQGLVTSDDQEINDVTFNEFNSVLRVLNSKVATELDPVTALLDRNNPAIENFPGTIQEVNTLDGPAIDKLCERLGIAPPGNLEEKKGKLLEWIGVKLRV